MRHTPIPGNRAKFVNPLNQMLWDKLSNPKEAAFTRLITKVDFTKEEEAETKLLIGFCYENGLSTEDHRHDIMSATQEYRAAAAMGNTQAKLKAALIDTYAVDHEKAFSIFSAVASEKTDDITRAEALFYIGECYTNGLGTLPNAQLAFQDYKASADMGNPSAMTHLGQCYQFGYGHGLNKNNAFIYYKRASELGKVSALAYVARCHEKGFGTAQDMGAAVKIYEEAVNLKSIYAMNMLGRLLENGAAGIVPKDEARALALFSKAEKSRSSSASLYLGEHFQRKYLTQGNPADWNTAYSHFEKSSERGNSYAHLILATLFLNDLATSYDLDKKTIEEVKNSVFKLCQQSAEANNPQAIIFLAKCHEQGIGTAINPQLAADLHLKYGLFLAKESNPNQNLEDAIECYEKSAELGNTEAFFFISNYYEQKENSTPADKMRADALYDTFKSKKLQAESGEFEATPTPLQIAIALDEKPSIGMFLKSNYVHPFEKLHAFNYNQQDVVSPYVTQMLYDYGMQSASTLSLSLDSSQESGAAAESSAPSSRHLSSPMNLLTSPARANYKIIVTPPTPRNPDPEIEIEYAIETAAAQSASPASSVERDPFQDAIAAATLKNPNTQILFF